MYNVHVCHDCRRIQHTPSPSLEIILPAKMFVLLTYPLRGVNIGNLPLFIRSTFRDLLCGGGHCALQALNYNDHRKAFSVHVIGLRSVILVVRLKGKTPPLIIDKGNSLP